MASEAVYKYYESTYHEDICNNFFYLNTFKNIKEIDNRYLIGDPDEAVSYMNVNLDIGCGDDPEVSIQIDSLKSLGTGIPKSAKTQNVIIRDLQYIINLPNAYMYCVTKRLDHKYWENEHHYDRCIQINDFDEFADRIGYALNEKHALVAHTTAPCAYERNNGYISNNGVLMQRPNYFKKTKKHRQQREVRAVYLVKNPEIINPIKIHIDTSNLIEFIR